MEAIVAASKSTLVDSLSFGLPPIASYIQSRNQVSIFSEGGNHYSPQGVRQIRFRVNTTGGPFVDLSSIAIQAKVTNDDGTNPLTFLGPNLGTLVQEMRIYVGGGVEVERIQFANRLESMLQRFLPENKRIHAYDSGFGYSSGNVSGNFVASAIAAGGSETVVWSPTLISGLLSQKNYLPSAFCQGLVIELLLCNTAAEVVDSTAGKSTSWSLSDVRLLCDTVSVDPSMLTALSSKLLSGTELTIPFKSYSTTMYSINAPTAQLVNARAFTRLDQALLTFFKSEGATAKECNTFYLSPQGQDLSIQLQIGERLWPDQRCDNLAQHWHRLLQGLGLGSSNSTINITKAKYGSDSFVSLSDVECVPGQAGHSGTSTHNAQMVFDIRDMGVNSADLPTKCFVTSWYNAILTVGQDGCSVAI